MDLYVPAVVQPPAKEFCTQALLLCAPIWNENGYAAQKTAYLESRLKLVNAVRKYGGLSEASPVQAGVRTYSELRGTISEPFLPGLREHLKFRGMPSDDIDAVLKHWPTPPPE